MTTVRSVDLFLHEGSSDKHYRVQIDHDGTNYNLSGFNGRRGSALKQQPKGSFPTLPDAEKAFASLVNSKTRKGYKGPAEGNDDAATMSAIAERTDTGLRPQLLNAIEEHELDAFLRSDLFCLQQKHDGERVIIRRDGATVVAANRNGLARPIPTAVESAIQSLPAERFVLDGELVGDRYYAFDILELDREPSIATRRYEDRYPELERLVDTASTSNGSLHTVETYVGETQKRTAYQNLRDSGAEGVVFKDLSKPVTTGRPNSGGPARKYKFWASLSALVTSINASKRSVQIAVIDANENTIPIGNVTIPPNHPIPPKHARIEVRYLYAYRNGSVFHPVYLGDRSDEIARKECRVEQLKYKDEPAA